MANKLVVLSARLESEYIEALDKVAKSQGITRSKLLRKFASDAGSLYSFLEQKQEEQAKLDGNFSRWILEHQPPGTTVETMQFVAAAMNHAVEMMQERLRTGEAKEPGEKTQA